MPHSQENKNRKQKQYRNKFHKHLKNGGIKKKKKVTGKPRAWGKVLYFGSSAETHILHST